MFVCPRLTRRPLRLSQTSVCLRPPLLTPLDPDSPVTQELPLYLPARWLGSSTDLPAPGGARQSPFSVLSGSSYRGSAPVLALRRFRSPLRECAVILSHVGASPLCSLKLLLLLCLAPERHLQPRAFSPFHEASTGAANPLTGVQKRPRADEAHHSPSRAPPWTRTPAPCSLPSSASRARRLPVVVFGGRERESGTGAGRPAWHGPLRWETSSWGPLARPRSPLARRAPRTKPLPPPAWSSR